jgi:hypothetical protein
MLKGMEDFEDSDFSKLEDIKGAMLGVLNHELEVFDPICDGPIEHAEGIAIARELVARVFQEMEMQKIELEQEKLDQESYI